MDVGEENGVNILAVVQVLAILFGLEVVDREIGQHMILQCFAVGQETDDLILLRILELGHQRNALVAGSVDQDPLAFAMPLTAVFEPVIDDNHGNTHNHQF